MMIMTTLIIIIIIIIIIITLTAVHLKTRNRWVLKKQDVSVWHILNGLSIGPRNGIL
jgi:MFS-type transporter involved in bile tolerance (Atg22 family)